MNSLPLDSDTSLLDAMGESESPYLDAEDVVDLMAADRPYCRACDNTGRVSAFVCDKCRSIYREWVENVLPCGHDFYHLDPTRVDCACRAAASCKEPSSADTGERSHGGEAEMMEGGCESDGGDSASSDSVS
jgi:hypothetical protein